MTVLDLTALDALLAGNVDARRELTSRVPSNAS